MTVKSFKTVTRDGLDATPNPTKPNPTKPKVDTGGEGPPRRRQVLYSEEFENWWKTYPPNKDGRKRAKEKTFGIWKKLSPEERNECQVAAKNYAAEAGEYVRDPERFLAKGFWRDYVSEPEKPRNANIFSADDFAI